MSGRDDIEAVIAAQVDAWNRGDAAGFSAAVSADCVFTNIFGQVFVGPEAFEAQHARIFATIYKGSRVTMKIAHLRFLRPDVAAVDLEAELVRAPGAQGDLPPVVRTRLLQVLAMDGGAWKVSSFHNVPVSDPPR